MKTKTSKFLLTFLCLLLAFALLPVLQIQSVSADSVAVANFIKDHATGSENNQELTSSLTSFTTDFGDKNGTGTTTGWSIPSFSGVEVKQVNSADLTSDATIGYTETDDVTFSSIGTDGTEGNKFGLLFLLKEKGIAGIESGVITIPARGLYVLTFNAKIGKLANTAGNYGINAKIIEVSGDETVKTYSMNALKTVNEEYESYAFVIQGNEYTDKTIKIQFLFGNAVEENGVTTKNEQIGYAAIDSIRFFGASYSQFNELSSDKNAKLVSLLSENSSYINIDNGYFNVTENQKWKLEDNTALSDFRPYQWKQEGGEDATYGVVNTNAALFTERMAQLGISAVNPEASSSNNVLMLYNSSASHQKITSASFKLSSNSYYEISFRFNTPANADQTNGLSFYLVDKEKNTIYSKENVFSYTEFNGNNNEWATFHAFIKTDSKSKDVNFIIKFGTEEKQTTGYAFVDDVRLYTTRTSSAMFDNTQKDTFELTKGEDETETKYLKEGVVSFDDLKELDPKSEANRSMAVYDYSAPVEEDDKTEIPSDTDKDTNTEESSNSSLIWYVIPSVLLGICLIGGLIIFYTKRIKIKKHTKRKKANYDRKKTLNKQVAKRERDAATLERGDYEAQLESVRNEIEALENEYAKNEKDKKSPLSLEKYLSKRQKLQNKENRLIEQIKKLK